MKIKIYNILTTIRDKSPNILLPLFDWLRYDVFYQDEEKEE